MELLDPATGQPLGPDAIQRVLFLAHPVHVYNIPPLDSLRGHRAASWTTDPSRHIFSARLRVVESSSEGAPAAEPSLQVQVVLEDPSNGQLFAAAPYLHPSAVESVLDSSRFFAITIRHHDGRKAVLGIGFEDRSDAFDFSVALQEAARNLGFSLDPRPPNAKSDNQDYSLKEGEKITINLGSSKLRRRPQNPDSSSHVPQVDETSDPFVLPPPPTSSKSGATVSPASFSLPPPPTADDVKRKRRSAHHLGFDDGKFGEFK